MKSIAFWNRKGGTGKTTTAGNVAFELRHYGRTLLVDCDPQANLTSWYGPEGIERELADVLTGGCELSAAAVRIREGLDLVPSFAIGGELKRWSETELPGKPFAFADLRDAIERAGYTYVVYDLAPGDSLLEWSALASVDEVVLVASPEYFSADGLESATDSLDRIRRDRRGRFQSGRLVVNRVNRSYAAHTVLAEEFSGNGFDVYQIGQSTGIHDAVMSHQSVFEYEPGNRYTSEYQRLAQEIAK
jgi:chromosome partitioning protein